MIRKVSLKQKVTDKVDEVRLRRPFVDHVIRMVQHYGAVKGNLQAGAVTYFAFLSFFPILALAFAVIGWVANVYPKAQKNLVDAINEVLPNLVGPDPGQVQLSSIQDAAGAAAGIGLVAVLYSGLGWLSSLREALTVVFEETKDEAPGFLTGKLRDLTVMVTIGVVLILSVVVSAVVTSLSDHVLDWLGLGSGFGWLLNLLGIAVGLLANMVLFFLFFKLLADPPLPARSMWSGALLGAVLFEVLKQASRFLLQATVRESGLPGVRHRADPGRLDQLLLPGRHVRRGLGVHVARGSRDPRSRGGRGGCPDRCHQGRPEEDPRSRGPVRQGRPGQGVRAWQPVGARRGRRAEEEVMRLERRHAFLLIGVAVWNFVIWATFAKNLYAAHADGEDRPTGYWVAHTILIIVNIILGAVLGRLGLKILKHR